MGGCLAASLGVGAGAAFWTAVSVNASPAQ
jgi:hypothetical protein